jgi:hypothetical protein
LNISKQSLSSKNLSRTHRQAPRKNTINLGHAPSDFPVYSEVNTPLTVNASGIYGPLYGRPSGLIEPCLPSKAAQPALEVRRIRKNRSRRFNL